MRVDQARRLKELENENIPDLHRRMVCSLRLRIGPTIFIGFHHWRLLVRRHRFSGYRCHHAFVDHTTRPIVEANQNLR
jgi:ABC-type polysaccharide transport system permease subunit